MSHSTVSGRFWNGEWPVPASTDNLVAVLEAIAPVSGNGAVAVITTPKLRVAIDLLLPRQPPFVVLASATLASGTIIAVALNALVSAVEGPPEIDASTDAVVHEETGPSANIGGGFRRNTHTSFASSARRLARAKQLLPALFAPLLCDKDLAPLPSTKMPAPFEERGQNFRRERC